MRERSFDDSVKMRLSHIIILLAILQLLCVGQVFSQPNNGRISSELTHALSTGNTDELARSFNDRVEITINDVRDVYSLTQAKFVMKKFFTDFPPSDTFTFSPSHTGNTETTIYAIGTYKSSRGNFEVNMFLKRSGDGEKIDRIRFDRK